MTEQFMEMLKEGKTNYWAERILTEIGYLLCVAQSKEKAPDPVLTGTAASLYARYKDEGAITKASAIEAEKRLLPLSGEAREYKIMFAGHAHIDMNWMWGYQETVNLTIDTFHTMLKLMEEYPQFTFSQSQASVYEMIEKFSPSMLPAIRRRIQEGRWEVTASSWVEPDKNMSGTESQARHILYTKQYLSKLLEIPGDSMEIDFEPDTFGHSACVPEILNQGGVKYYYHCRGFDKYSLFRWRAPSGAEVLVDREADWYLGPVRYDKVWEVPDYCRKNRHDTMLCVYGVGDHGGGPTRRDIERIIDMQGWPLMPQVSFGTLKEFFHGAEKNRENFPIVEDELNYVLTGCYTTQGRIKLANRVGEDRMYDAEALTSMASISDTGKSEISPVGIGQAWKNVLFNQFHDILPGSGVAETREYAMGRFQEALAYAGSNAGAAMRVLGDWADTSFWGESTGQDSSSEGAGAGYGVGQTGQRYENGGSWEYGFTQTHRGKGDARAYTLFNTTQYEREELVTITVWDWDYDEEEITVLDSGGNKVPCQVLERGTQYWQHTYIKLVFKAIVPPMGYASYCVKRDAEKLSVHYQQEINDHRVHSMEDGKIVLENDRIRAEFSTETMKLTSFLEKCSGQELTDTDRPAAGFRYIEEDDTYRMTSWIVGTYTKVVDINETSAVKIIEKQLEGMRKWIDYKMSFGRSGIGVRVSLDEGSSILKFDLTVDWQESGKEGCVPQLQFYVPVGYKTEEYLCDIPCGCKERPALGHDVPTVYYGAALPQTAETAMFLTSNCKYGFRGNDCSMAYTLLRGAYDPDPYPDLGIHYISLGLGVENSLSWSRFLKQGILFSHPIYAYSNTIHKGSGRDSQSFLCIDGDVKLSALKIPESEKNAWILRLYHCSPQDETATLRSYFPIERAELTDILEQTEDGGEVEVENSSKVELTIPPYGIRTIKITFKG